MDKGILICLFFEMDQVLRLQEELARDLKQELVAVYGTEPLDPAEAVC